MWTMGCPRCPQITRGQPGEPVVAVQHVVAAALCLGERVDAPDKLVQVIEDEVLVVRRLRSGRQVDHPDAVA